MALMLGPSTNTQHTGRSDVENHRNETPIRLLVIDDDSVDRQAVRRYLRQASLPVSVDQAASASEGLARIGAEAIDFLRFTAREIAAGLGVPYEVLTGDLSQVNYSSIRAGLLEFRRRVEAHQHNVLVFQLLRPIWRAFVTAEILSGRIAAPGFGRNPELWLGARWITPRFDWVDPRKDVEAELAAIEGGLMSRRQAVAARGYDLEALDQEIADDNARAARLGLSFGRRDAAAADPKGDANADD